MKPLSTLGGNVNLYSHYGNNMQVPQKLKVGLLYDLDSKNINKERKIDKLDFIKIKTFVLQRCYKESEKTTKKMEKICACNIYNEGLIYLVYSKELKNPIIQRECLY